MKGGLTFFNSPQIVMEFIFKCLCPLERFQLRSINTLSRRWILYDGSLNVSLWLVFAVKENADAQKVLKRLDIVVDWASLLPLYHQALILLIRDMHKIDQIASTFETCVMLSGFYYLCAI